MKKPLTILAAVLAIVSTQAQVSHIIYKEFEPDSCFTFQYDFDTLKFDLDQDGIGDIVLYAYWHSAVGNIAVITTPSSNWQWSWKYANSSSPLTDTTMLNGNISWQNSGGELAMYPERTHFAFRHLTEEGYSYGWARIYIESFARVCIDEMAYCTIPNYPLVWGQTELVGIEEAAATTFATLHPNPTTGLVTITGENLRQAEVFNTLGQQLLSVQGKGNELHIDLGVLPVGLYFVTVTDNEGRKCVRKVVKK